MSPAELREAVERLSAGQPPNREAALRVVDALLEALESGAPPHGGIAFGFDRVVEAAISRRGFLSGVLAFGSELKALRRHPGFDATLDRDAIGELVAYGCEVNVHDPLADPAEADEEYGIRLCEWNSLPEAVQKKIVEVTAAFEPKMVEHFQKAIQAEWKELEKIGINRIKFSQEEADKYLAAAYQVEWDELAKWQEVLKGGV